MIQLTDVERKEQIANEVQRLITELNVQIRFANDISLRVRINQNTGLGIINSDVCAWVSETVSY